jgi:hypothetical protein
MSTARLHHRVAAKLGLEVDWAGAGRQLIETVNQVKPNLVWIEKGTLLHPDVLRAIKRSHPQTRLAWFSEDDMFAKHNRTSRFDRALPLYDLVFTTKSYNANSAELPSLGAHRVVYVHQTYDPAQHFPPGLSDEDITAYGSDLGFIGNYEFERARSMNALAKAGLAVRVWGNGWRRCPFSDEKLRLELRPLVNLPPDDLKYSKGIAATAINLCFLRKVNRDLHTSRTFEITAVGGFMLAERTPEHVEFFREGVEAEFFSSEEELIQKSLRYLADPATRKAIAAAGQRRCLRDYGPEKQAFAMLTQTLGPAVGLAFEGDAPKCAGRARQRTSVPL